jgi:uncharacterized protein YjbI with pentapeptide repeats
MNETDCSEADFSGANLSEVNFKHACLKSACFVNAKLSDADFGAADLTDADFSGAELIEAKFRRVDLRKVNNISPEELELAIIDSKTQVPDYIEVKWTSEDTYECRLK